MADEPAPAEARGEQAGAGAAALLRVDPATLPDEVTSEWLLDRFLEFVSAAGLELYPAQEEAVLEVTQGNSVILNTPTGSGKSLVALAACFCSLARDERAYYSAPIKALVSEKFLELCRAFGPENVGMMTGDATVNSEAPIICCTAEILSNLALREGARADLEWVVLDEFHYYSDRDRGAAWQVPLLTLPQARFLLMSATLGDTTTFEKSISELTGRPTKLVKTTERPVPLDYAYVETPLHETVADVMKEGKAPVYIVHFSQRAAAEEAQRLTSSDFCSKEQKKAIKEELTGFRFDSPFGRELSRFLPHGIGVHHAGMLPKYRLLVEKLAQKGLLKVICGTDTLGVGVNVPIRTVLFTQLCKYDGDKTKLLSVRDFQQIAGRAGRRGFDTQGSVLVQAPEHVIENLVQRRKAEGDPKKLKKLHPKKPPEFGYVPWDEKTLERLKTADSEALTSRFEVTTGMLLSVLCREDGDGCRAMKKLLRECHEPEREKRRQARRAIEIFGALARAKVIELERGGARVHADLQEDFSLNHALGLFAVEMIDALDPDAPGHALTVLSLIEAILEDPTVVLRRQLDVLKGRRHAELKHAGVPYEERMEELEKLEWPKPERELIEAGFEAFTAHHPWVLGQATRPKSIVRDMFELGLGFNGYVKEYGLERAEGVLLRYLSEAYRTLQHSVPDAMKDEQLSEIIAWLGDELHRTDASLLEEWQRLSNPLAEVRAAEPTSEVLDVTKNVRAFSAAIKTSIFRVVSELSARRFTGAERVLVELSGAKTEFSADRLALELEPYFSEYETIDASPAARGANYVHIERGTNAWRVRQILRDPNEDLGCSLEFQIDLDRSRAAERPVAELVRINVD